MRKKGKKDTIKEKLNFIEFWTDGKRKNCYGKFEENSGKLFEINAKKIVENLCKKY